MYVIIGMGLFFLAIGFIVTENNAKYLLSGYNTMSEEDRKKIDIRSYIPYFRKFHVIFGISFLIIGLVLFYVIGEVAAGIFLGVYPIVAYLYFIWKSSAHINGVSVKWTWLGISVLSIVLIMVVTLFTYGFKASELTFTVEGIEFTGMYGERISPNEIKSIELVDQFPDVTFKINGFAMGEIKKGYFKTSSGGIIKLLLNVQKNPYILVIKTNGEKIYFASEKESNEAIYNRIKNMRIIK